MIMNVLIVSIVGGLLCLDRVFIQVLISRPIVAAPVIGLILGDPYTGLIAGAFIELFWIDRLPIGTYVPPNDTIAAVLIAAGAIESGRILGYLPQGLISLAVLIFIPVAIVAQKMELWMIRGNEKPAKEALNDALHGDTRSISKNHLRAALMNWFFPAGLILITLPIGVGVMTWVYPRLPPWNIRGLQLLYGLFPLIGVAVTLNTIRLRGTFPIFCAVFLAMTVILYYLRNV
jgi:mannose PTS system EIIC component